MLIIDYRYRKTFYQYELSQYYSIMEFLEFFLASSPKISSTAVGKQGFNKFSPIVCGFFDFAINCEILNDADRTFSFDSNLEPLVPSFIFFF